MKEQSAATSILSVRVSPDERALLEEAASQSRMTLSEFMRRKAVEAAEAEVLERGVVTIPAKLGGVRGVARTSRRADRCAFGVGAATTMRAAFTRDGGFAICPMIRAAR
ncbi:MULTISPECIES: DUF6290 family protein [Methylosinus]|uniref:DUF6290 family protein n=1 Tax=Methylosinus TaxID=425 RepID=UPI001FEDFCF2|nr:MULTISPECIES: DUF6290 family protein [Methylosinus]